IVEAPMSTQSTYVRTQMIAPLAPPRVQASALGWMRENLFSSLGNTLLTLLGAALLAALVWPTVRFVLLDAVWHGTDRTACLAETVGREVGACWPFIAARFDQLMFGFYPASERWRVVLVYGLGALLLAPLLIPRVPHKSLNAVLFFCVFPIVAGVLLLGGVLGLREVETRLWGGLLVTLVISYAGIVGSLPLGVLLALGRRSELPGVRSASIVFIEFWRGVPLLTVLFFATYMLPLFLPGNWVIDGL